MNHCGVCFRDLSKVICCTLTRWECGLFCDGACLVTHLRSCTTCASREAFLAVPDYCREAYRLAMIAAGQLPGFEHVPTDRAVATAEAQGEQLTAQLLTPAPSISRTTGQMERHSPLFRESSANSQLNLF